jgi:hypothetical protein
MYFSTKRKSPIERGFSFKVKEYYFFFFVAFFLATFFTAFFTFFFAAIYFKKIIFKDV